MGDLSVFVDESGNTGRSMYYLVTIVLHDQEREIRSHINAYEMSLRQKGLPDIPFHASPLMRGQDPYKRVSEEGRASLLNSFFIFTRRLPIAYKTLWYLRRGLDKQALTRKMRKDLVHFLFDNLEFFQRYERVKIYYDNGQSVVTEALHDAIGYALVKDAVEYRVRGVTALRLSQVADLICALELAGLKYAEGIPTKSDVRFFGTRRAFTRNYLRKIRKLAMA